MFRRSGNNKNHYNNDESHSRVGHPKYPIITYHDGESVFGPLPAMPGYADPQRRPHSPAPLPVPVQPAPSYARHSSTNGGGGVAAYGQMTVSPGQQHFGLHSSPCPPPLTQVSAHQPARRQPLQRPQPPPQKWAQSSIPEFTHQRTCKRKALVIGCNYTGTTYQLKGCLHDARNIRHMLCTEFGFDEKCITILLDDGSGHGMPTRNNILRCMRELVRGAKEGDSLFFHFSGHGSQEPDRIGDERDGLNETLLPCDFEQSGQLIDDEINRILINPLPRGVYLHAIIDACHSGTAMDLEFYTKWKHDQIHWTSDGPCRIYKGTSGGIAVLFSACTDSQVARDTDHLTGSVHTGAATQAFVETIHFHGTNQTYEQVLHYMLQTLRKVTGHTPPQEGMVDKLLGALKNEVLNALGHTKQTPQISSNIRLNLNEILHI